MLPPSFSSPARSTVSAAPSPPSQPSARAASAASRAISTDLASASAPKSHLFHPPAPGGGLRSGRRSGLGNSLVHLNDLLEAGQRMPPPALLPRVRDLGEEIEKV